MRVRVAEALADIGQRSACRGRLQDAVGGAVTTMLKLMLDPIVPAATRLRAAEDVMEQAAKLSEIEELEDRLVKLERTVGAASRPPKRSADLTWLSATPLPDPAPTRQIAAPCSDNTDTDEDVSE